MSARSVALRTGLCNTFSPVKQVIVGNTVGRFDNNLLGTSHLLSGLGSGTFLFELPQVLRPPPRFLARYFFSPPPIPAR